MKAAVAVVEFADDLDEGGGGGLADDLDKRSRTWAEVGVEIAGGLVGQQQARCVGQRPGDGDALLLAAGEAAGAVVEAVFEAEPGEEAAGAVGGLAAAFAGEELRQHDVLLGGEVGQEMVELVDEADAVAPECLCARHRRASSSSGRR
jgi:hypothetical protein